MRNTKLMLAGLSTFLLTWAFLGLVGYLLSNDVTYKECMTHEATIFILIVFGWIPVLVVFNDLLGE